MNKILSLLRYYCEQKWDHYFAYKNNQDEVEKQCHLEMYLEYSSYARTLKNIIRTTDRKVLGE